MKALERVCIIIQILFCISFAVIIFNGCEYVTSDKAVDHLERVINKMVMP